MSDTETRPAAPSRLGCVLLSAPFLLMGGYITGIGLRWVPYDSAKVHAPGWVIAVSGLVFVCGGLAVLQLAWRRASQPYPAFGAAILIGLALVCNWVAFGGGERNFTRSTSVNDVVVSSGPLDETSGRVAFGVGAVILDLVLVALGVKWWRRPAK